MTYPPKRIRSQRAIKLALPLLVVFLVVEALGGYFTNSLALLSDAAHLLTDIGALVLALVAFRFATHPPHGSHTYGHHRAEILAALINGLTLWAVAIYIVYEAYSRLADPPEIRTLYMLLIASVGFIGQAASALILRRAISESLNVKGAFVHVATDALQSAAIIVTAILILISGWLILDPLVSLVIAALIIWSGGRVVWAAINILLEGAPSDLNMVSLKAALEGVQGVEGIHDLHVWTITSGYNAMSAHVKLRQETGRDAAQSVLSTLRHLSSEDFGIEHVTIQVEERDMACPEDHAQV